MNLHFYLEQLHESDVFKEFMKENSEAYMCSGFFTIDKEGTDNQRHFDFYEPKSKQMFSFKLNGSGNIEKIPVEMLIKKVPEKLSDNFNIGFEEIEELIVKEMSKQEVKNKLQKIIVSLQPDKEKNMLICTVFVSMMGLLKVHIDLQDKKVTLFEKKSFFDLVRKG